MIKCVLQGEGGVICPFASKPSSYNSARADPGKVAEAQCRPPPLLTRPNHLTHPTNRLNTPCPSAFLAGTRTPHNAVLVTASARKLSSQTQRTSFNGVASFSSLRLHAPAGPELLVFSAAAAVAGGAAPRTLVPAQVLESCVWPCVRACVRVRVALSCSFLAPPGASLGASWGAPACSHPRIMSLRMLRKWPRRGAGMSVRDGWVGPVVMGDLCGRKQKRKEDD